MASCASCGTQGDDGTFCTNCGSSISASPVSMPTAAPAAAPQNWNALQNQKTNGFAIAALVVSIAASLLYLGWVGAIFGHVALSQIKRTGEKGRGMAIAGIVIGYSALALTVIVIGVIALGTAVTGSFYTVSSTL